MTQISMIVTYPDIINAIVFQNKEVSFDNILTFCGYFSSPDETTFFYGHRFFHNKLNSTTEVLKKKKMTVIFITSKTIDKITIQNKPT